MNGSAGDLPRVAAARRLAFALACVLTSVLLQALALGPSRSADFAPGAAFNACALLAVWWLCEPLARLSRVGSWLLYPLLLGLLGLLFAHTWFFDVAIERRLTLLDMTPSGVGYFFTGALPVAGRWALLATVCTLAGLSLLLGRALVRRPLRARSRWVMGALLLLATPLSMRAPRVPSPLYDSAYELWELASRPAVRAALTVPQAVLPQLDRSARTRGALPTRYRKVIVLVMETMTAQNFARESAALSSDTFVRAQRGEAHRYERYFPNNMDSRTGMLDMLFSRLVPYEAYSDDGFAHYRELARDSSLVDRMHELSYRSAFAVAQTTLEEVVSELPWDATLKLDERAVRTAKQQGKLCFTPDEYESSCEDLALLPQVLDFVTGNERAFVYQEFIWGHAAAYNEASGLSNTAYYSAYVDALRAGLRARGLLEQTLLVLTSDHGFRDKGRQHDPEVYRMPLWFSASDLQARSDARLFSHTDFGTLLFAHLAPADARVSAVTSPALVMIVGPTGQGNLFVASSEGGHLLLRHKAGRDIVLAQAGPMPLSPGALLAAFHAYRTAFDQRLRGLPAAVP